MQEPPADRRLLLRDVLIALRREHGIHASYSALWARIATGVVDAERGPDGRIWTVAARDVPRIAETLRPRLA